MHVGVLACVCVSSLEVVQRCVLLISKLVTKYKSSLGLYKSMIMYKVDNSTKRCCTQLLQLHVIIFCCDLLVSVCCVCGWVVQRECVTCVCCGVCSCKCNKLVRWSPPWHFSIFNRKSSVYYTCQTNTHSHHTHLHFLYAPRQVKHVCLFVCLYVYFCVW